MDFVALTRRVCRRRYTADSALLLLGLALAALNPPPMQAQTSPGTIAYVRGSDRREIHTIEANGTNDRTIWTEPTPTASVDSLAWRPDGAQLAFSSDHEEACSTFQNDIFVLGAGAGPRRVTNAPGCSELGQLPKGSVTVRINNRSSTSDNFFVYVAGAPEIQPLPLGPSGSGTVTFNDVAVLGDDVLQEIVVTNGTYRWLDPSTAVHVRPDEAVDAGVFTVYEQGGLKQHGAYSLVWKGDASQIAFGVGPCGPKYQTAADAGPTASLTPLLMVDALACYYDRGPTPTLANRVLYYDLGASVMYLTSAGSQGPGEVLLSGEAAEFIHAVQWLPDGSGFVFAKDRLNDDIVWSGNLYEYSLATRAVRQITSLSDGFANYFTLSPDGQWIVFERSRAQFREGSLELWLVRRDGTQPRRLVSDGQLPAWAPRPL
jgi:TolB protein